ncbi:MAG: hypothetical protein OSA21_07175, partial [Candidatus Poseidoniaceae archaeon]|nr:hypothetical protein [Candidatus Poseidoniaceae archaeon]
MGGLLDKANATKTDTMDAEVVAEKVTVNATKVIETLPVVKGETFFQTANPIGLGLAGLGFVLMWFLNNYWFEDITGPIPFGLVVISIMAGSFYLVWDSIDRQKTVTLLVGYLMLTSVPYLAGLEIGSSPGVSEISVNEDSNELSFVVRGSFSSATAELLIDGESLWSESKDMSNDRTKFSVPLATIFIGNSQDHLLSTVNTYSIRVAANTGDTSTVEISPTLMNREIENSAAKLIMRTETTEDGDSLVVGVTVEALVGMFSSSAAASAGGEHDMTSTSQKRLPIPSDYTIQLKILQDGTQTYESAIIEVDGLSATWTPVSNDLANFGSTNGWLAMPGNTLDANGVYEFIERDEFFEDDGCYNFQ